MTASTSAAAVSRSLRPSRAAGAQRCTRSPHLTHASAPNTTSPLCRHLGVLLGSIISFLGSRVTTFGLADLRGGLHPGFDEGAWITTALRHRPDDGRRLLALSRRHLRRPPRSAARASCCCSPPACSVRCHPISMPSWSMQFLGGVGSGTFIPLTISFIVRSLPARLVIYGIAVYAMNSELSQNVAASLEGWYVGQLVLALDRLAILRGAAADVRLHLVRRAAREDQHRADARPRLARHCLCRSIGFGAALRRPRPGQPARLDQQRAGHRPAAVRRPDHFGLRRPRADHSAAVPEPAAACCAAICCCCCWRLPASASSSSRPPTSSRPTCRPCRISGSCRSAACCCGSPCRSLSSPCRWRRC